MSKVFKGIKKVFKKVAKVVKKVLPIALAVGALVFTGGAALGLAPMAGGWGAAAAGIAGKLGASGVVGSALTGAITQAGYGALIGGTISKIGGGSFSKGAQTGALAGTVSGGLMGAAGMATDPLAGIGEKATAGAAEATAGVAKAPAVNPQVTGQVAGAPNVGASTAVGASGTTAPATTGGGGLLSQGGWLERNQTLAGNVISGLGQGLMASGQADAEVDAMRERQRLRGANYEGADPGAGYRDLAPGQSGQTPTERFDPRVYGQYEYRYNRDTGRIERVRVEGGG